jgi:cystathionine beta-synthase
VSAPSAPAASAAPEVLTDVLTLVGNTPMVKVTHLDTGPCELFLKLENRNPGHSIKDRIGLAMIRAAEEAGALGPHQKRLVEATSGNTGIALALVAAQRGYTLTLVIPDKMSQEKIFHLKALGAEIVLTRSDVGKGHAEYYQEMAERIARETGAFYVNQFANPANPRAHEETTGPEILAQLHGEIDAMVCGVGSGGTITGLSRFFAKNAPSCEMVLADPQGSVLVDYVKTGKMGQAGSWLVEGIGEDFLPDICDLSRVKHAYSIPDAESFATARSLLRHCGLLVGSSTGTLVSAALRYCREQTTPKRVCTFVCDSGNKYLSKMFNEFWMADQGLVERPRSGDLREIITHRFADRTVFTVGPDDTLLIAYGRMKLYDVSQLPVVEAGKVVGVVDESDLLLHAVDDPTKLRSKVREVMATSVRTVASTTPVREVLPLLAAGLVPIVVEGSELMGIVTRIDVLNYLRRSLH